MKYPIALLAVLFGLASMSARAAAPAASAAGAKPTLGVVIVDSLARSMHSFDDFDRIVEEWTTVFERQNWPVTIDFERFAANNRSYDYELRVFYRGIDSEFRDQVFRAWLTLNDRGTKRDFGIVQFRYTPRPAEPVDDVVRAVFRGAAKKVVPLIAPHVAPADAKSSAGNSPR